MIYLHINNLQKCEDFVNIFISYSKSSTQYIICHINKARKGCSDVLYYVAME